MQKEDTQTQEGIEPKDKNEGYCGTYATRLADAVIENILGGEESSSSRFSLVYQRCPINQFYSSSPNDVYLKLRTLYDKLILIQKNRFVQETWKQLVADISSCVDDDEFQKKIKQLSELPKTAADASLPAPAAAADVGSQQDVPLSSSMFSAVLMTGQNRQVQLPAAAAADPKVQGQSSEAAAVTPSTMFVPSSVVGTVKEMKDEGSNSTAMT